MNSLFEDNVINLNLPDAEFLYYPAFINNPDDTFKFLLENVSWAQESTSIYGKAISLPRLTAWYGEASYTYSGIKNEPKPMLPVLESIKTEVEKISSCTFNAVLLNCYRDGSDSVSFHRDNERGLGHNPVVASVSLGSERVFRLKHLKTKKLTDLVLANGSLLVMGNQSQVVYAHSIIKNK